MDAGLRSLARIAARAAVSGAIVGVLLATPAPVWAGLNQPTPPGLAYLRDEPVTLLDLGFLRLQRDLDRVSAALVDPDYADQAPRSGVFYAWRGDRIEAYVTYPTAAERRTVAGCVDRFVTISRALTGGGPDGPDRVQNYLERTFSHSGPGFWSPRKPRSFAKDLVAALRFSVTLTGDTLDQRAGDLYTVQCTGPLDATADAIRVRESGS